MHQKGFASIVLVLTIILLAIGGMFYYNSSKKLSLTLSNVSSPESTPSAKETKTVYINSLTNKFISYQAGYTFEYSSDYYLNYNLATFGFSMGISTGDGNRETFYGGLGELGDEEGTKYTREFVTSKGYTVNQSVTIKSLDHPQGLGTVNTHINNSGKMFTLVAFIQPKLETIQKQKGLATLTEQDYLELLDELKVNSQIINTLEFF